MGKYSFDTELIERDKRYLVLIIYDITDNKRRQKMVKYLESYGIRIQKSAFECLLGKKLYMELTAGIPKLIVSEDNVRIYRLNGNGEVLTWGGEKVACEDIIFI